MRARVRQLTTIVTAIALFTAMAAAPVAAGDGLLGDGGLGGDAIDIGTDDGINVSLGGDSGVDVGASPNDGVAVGAGGDDGGSVGVSPDDGVEVGTGGDTTTIGPDGVGGAGSDGVGDIGSGTVDDVTSGIADGTRGVGDVGSGVTDGTLGDAGAGSLPSGVASLAETPQGVETVDGLGSAADVTDAGLLGGGLPTDGLPTDGLPSDGVGDGLPTGDVGDGLPTGDVGDTLPSDGVGDSLPSDELPSGGLDPENFPVGDDRAQVNVCDPLNPDSSELPTDAVPGINDLPSSVVPSTLPTNLLTNEAVVGIILGITPAPCEVFNPNEPQIDPTNPPTSPDYTFDILRLNEYRGGAVYLIDYGGTLNETSGTPGVSGTSGLLANPDDVDVDQVLVMNDGRNEYGGELHFRNIDSQTDSFKGSGVLILMGGEVGAQGNCRNLQEYQPDLTVESLEENPLGPCQFKPVGVTRTIGPGEVIRILTETGDVGGGEDLPVNPDSLPIDPDELLNL